MGSRKRVFSRQGLLKAVGGGLVVVGSMLLLVWVWVPVSALLSPGEDVGDLIEHARAVSKATIFYSESNDHRLPLAVARSSSGYSWAEAVPFPAKTGRFQTVWPNSVASFLPPRRRSYLSFSAPQVKSLSDGEGLLSAFTYNGLLHGYNSRRISYEELLVLIWTGTGDTCAPGYAVSTPILMCGSDGAACRFRSEGGPSIAAFLPVQSLAVVDDDSLIVFADGHVRFRSVSALGIASSSGHPYDIATKIDAPQMFRPDVAP